MTPYDGSSPIIRSAAMSVYVLVCAAGCAADPSATVDGGTADAGSVDDASIDAGSIDDGSTDAGPVDVDAAIADASIDATTPTPDAGPSCPPEGCACRWEIQSIAPIASDSSSERGARTAIAVDPAGAVHIAFHDHGPRTLGYATNRTGSWVVETVDAALGSAEDGVGIALSSAGSVDIVYSVDSPGVVRHASNAGGSWALADLAAHSPVDLALARAPDGALHVLYSRRHAIEGDYVIHLVRAAGTDTWTPTYRRVSDPRSVDIALDDRGNVHFSYNAFSTRFDPPYMRLHVSSNASGEWVDLVFDGTRNAFSSIGVDELRNTYVSSRDTVEGDLWLLSDESGEFRSQLVDAVSDVGVHSSLAVEPAGTVHILHQDAIRNDLLHSTNVSGVWETITVDDDGSTGRYSDVVFAGRVLHVSYMRSMPEGELRYARRVCP